MNLIYTFSNFSAIMIESSKSTGLDYLQVVSVIVIDSSKNNAHEHVQTDYQVHSEVQSKPITLVVSRHPVNVTRLG